MPRSCPFPRIRPWRPSTLRLEALSEVGRAFWRGRGPVRADKVFAMVRWCVGMSSSPPRTGLPVVRDLAAPTPQTARREPKGVTVV